MDPIDVRSLGNGLRSGRFSSVQLTERFLQLAADSRYGAWRTLTPERALAQARAADELLSQGTDLGPLHGIPVGLKDNIGMAGETNRAGMHPDVPLEAEAHDSAPAARLAAAGAVFIGRLNMTELAYTALGLNRQGTPINPAAPDRVPGGSSSGSAVAVAAGEVPVALGSDTGGSIRIPAAYTGVFGLKLATGSVDLTGVFPLSTTLDTVGPLARDLTSTELAFGVMQPAYASAATAPGQLRALVPENVFLDELDAQVAQQFERAVAQLEGAGVSVVRRKLPVIDEVQAAYALGTVPGWEAFLVHGDLLRAHQGLFGAVTDALQHHERDRADYEKLLATRLELIGRYMQETSEFDLTLTPTVASVPPLLSDAVMPENEGPLDWRGLRNTMIGNFLGLAVLSVPLGDLTGLSLSAPGGSERALFAAARLLG